MNSTASELHDVIPSHIGLPVEFTNAVRFLAVNHGSFVPISSIPGLSAEDRGKLLFALHTAGLIKFKKPGFSAD